MKPLVQPQAVAAERAASDGQPATAPPGQGLTVESCRVRLVANKFAKQIKG